jgi:hypothetical protein
MGEERLDVAIVGPLETDATDKEVDENSEKSMGR